MVYFHFIKQTHANTSIYITNFIPSYTKTTFKFVGYKRNSLTQFRHVDDVVLRIVTLTYHRRSHEPNRKWNKTTEPSRYY